MIFDNEKNAKRYFGNRLELILDDIDIEACDKCGRFSVSQADDYYQGEIVSAHCDYDRICLTCDTEEASIDEGV